MQMKICLIAYHKVVRYVWIFSQYSVKLTTKLQAYLFVTQRMHSLQFVWEKITGHYEGTALHCCQTRLSLVVLTFNSPRTAVDDYTGQYCRVWDMKRADQVALCT